MRVSLTLYALDNITDFWQFESLCNDLLFREGFKYLKPHGKMHDNGIDASIHVHEANSRIIFQYSTQKSFAEKIKNTLLKLTDNGEQCDELHYVSSREISYSVAKDLIAFAEGQYGTRLEIYDREWLRIRLDNSSSDLRRKYLGVSEELEYSVDYKGYWVKQNGREQSYVIELLWLDNSDVHVLQTTITATPSDNLISRFSQLSARGAFNFPTILFLENIASICQYHVNTQVIDQEPVTNTVVVQDNSGAGRGFSLEIETRRLVPMPDDATVVYLLNYVPGVCDALKEEVDKEISIQERSFYSQLVQQSGVKPKSIEGERVVRASDLKLSPTTLLWTGAADI